MESCFTWILLNIQLTQPRLMRSSGIPARRCVAEVYGQYLVTQPQVRTKNYEPYITSFHCHDIKNQHQNGPTDKVWNLGDERSRFSSVQVFRCKISGEMTCPNVYSFVSRRHVGAHLSGANRNICHCT